MTRKKNKNTITTSESTPTEYSDEKSKEEKIVLLEQFLPVMVATTIIGHPSMNGLAQVMFEQYSKGKELNYETSKRFCEYAEKLLDQDFENITEFSKKIIDSIR